MIPSWLAGGKLRHLYSRKTTDQLAVGLIERARKANPLHLGHRKIRVPIDPGMPCPIPRIPNSKAGMTLSWDLDSNFTAVEHTKISMCLSHWIDGQSWEETGILELHEYHIREVAASGHGSTREELLHRYYRLDDLRELARNTGPGALDRDITSSNKDPGGILFHIGRSSEEVVDIDLMLDINMRNQESKVGNIDERLRSKWSDLGVQAWFGGSGCHRLAIGLSLGFDWVPGVLGVIHTDVRLTVPNLL